MLGSGKLRRYITRSAWPEAGCVRSGLPVQSIPVMNIPPNEAWGERPEAALLLWSVKGFPMDEARRWNALQLHEVAAWLLSQQKPLTDAVAERIEGLADQAVHESRDASSTRGRFAAIVEMIRRLLVPFAHARVKQHKPG